MSKRFSKILISSTSAFCFFIASFSYALPQKITEVEGISEYKLDNGLKILLFPDQSKDTVTVNITYRVGSKHENYGETGMAHLLEHMVFKGTPNHKDIPKELSSHGARPNGTTWTDRTNYFETFSASQENIDWALDMEADRMVNSFIAQKDLDSEMTVVRNEFERGENSPFGVTLKRLMASAFSWHNYGKSTIGARSDLENVPAERLKAFYKKYYQPDNATLVVAGKFSTKEMLAKIERYFSKISKPKRQLPSIYTVEPSQDGEKEVTVRRVGDVQLYASAYHIPAGSHPDFSAIEVLSSILSETPSGRLHKKVVESKLASRTFGMNFQWADPGLMIFGAQIDQSSDINKAALEINTVVEGIEKDPITKKELDRAKRKLIKGFELRFNSSENVAKELSEWVGMGDWRLLFLNRDRIEAVTVADVQRVATKYLQRNNRTAGKFIPTKKPERVDIPLVADLDSMVKGYVGREAISAGELFDPSFENIDKRSHYSQLRNGLKLVLLPKETRGDVVSATLSFNLGTEKSLHSKADIGDAVGAMLQRGTSKYSREELQDEFDKLKSSVSIGGSATGINVTINSNRDNFIKVLELVAHALKQPAFDKSEFEQYKAALKVDIEQSLQNPQSLAFAEYSRRHRDYKPGHPLYVASFEEALVILENLRLQDLPKFHKAFYGSQYGEIAVVGDFDSSKVKSELDKLFGSWNNPSAFSRIERPFKALEVRTTAFDTPDKENAVFVATLSIPISEEHQDSPALLLGNYILGGGFLNSRLATRLRQKDGLSYSAGSFLRSSALDNRTALGIYAICAPQNLKKVELGFTQVIATLLKDGFTEEEISSAKAGLLQGTKVSRSQDRELTGQLVGNSYLGRTMKWHQSFEEHLNALTAEDVVEAMRKHIKLDDFSIITGGDISKAKS